MPLRVALAQCNPIVGDIDGNAAMILSMWHKAAVAGADLVVFSELVLTGYPPEDLLLKPDFLLAEQAALRQLALDGPAGCVAVVGHVDADPDSDDEPTEQLASWDTAISARNLHNAASVLRDGAIAATYRKLRLPNYGVFDEARYFTSGDQPVVVDVSGVPVGIAICEDMWAVEGPFAASAAAGAKVIVSPNASPYHRNKRASRESWAARHARRDGVFVLFVNQVGGQDEVVFDGDSFAMTPDGSVGQRAAFCEAGLAIADLDVDTGSCTPVTPVPLDPDPVGAVWDALVLATRDYVAKNGFAKVWVALSGGIDSAVVGALAVDALGPDAVTGVALPSPHSSDHSLADAHGLAANLGITCHELAIEPAMVAFEELLGTLLTDEFGLAEENLQSRIRGTVMMALSNEHGGLVLTTGNKSEYAVGYATLYGDMNGAFGPIKDVPKTLVWELARLRNTRPRPVGGATGGDGATIPWSSIDKPPSAELRPGQLDQDSLPEYELLDAIIEGLIEDDRSVEELVADGFDEEVVRDIRRKIDRAEFKRRQSAPGPKITKRAFGRERRVPITNGWHG